MQDNLVLLLADVRQALFDEVKADPNACVTLRYEVGRAVGLMGRAMDVAKAQTEALRLCLSFIERFKEDGVELLGEGVHAGLRKGSEATDSGHIYDVIAKSRTSAWSDAMRFAHDPFFSMWGGDEALRKARVALALVSEGE